MSRGAASAGRGMSIDAGSRRQHGRHDLPPMLLRAIADGWRGLTVVPSGRGATGMTLVRVCDEPVLGPDAALWIGAEHDLGLRGPAQVTLRLGNARTGPLAERVSLDLRLAAVRSLVREAGRTGSAGLVEVCARDGVPALRGAICLHPARDLLRTAVATAGEWSARDPGDGLASALPWRLERDPRLPQLVGGARIGDPPALVVLAGTVTAELGGSSVEALERPRDVRERALVESAWDLGRITVAEVAVGALARVTWIRSRALA